MTVAGAAPEADAGALGLARELDRGSVARGVARQLRPDERDGGTDGREDLRVLGVDDGRFKRAATRGTSASPAPPRATSGTSGPKLVLTCRVGDRLDDLVDRTVEQLRARRASGVRLQPLGRAARTRPAPPRGRRTSSAFVDQSEGVAQRRWR